MKLISLNVNRFAGLLSCECTDHCVSMAQTPKANEIADAVKEWLAADRENIVFLEEVPYAARRKRRALYDEFVASFLGKGYRIILPNRKAPIFCTLAVVREESGWDAMPCAFTKDYQNRYVLARHSSGLCVLGLHAPIQGSYNKPEAVEAFFEALREYAAIKIREERAGMVILGDMNVHSGKPCVYYDIFNAIRSGAEDSGPGDGLGYRDLVPDGQITYFPNGNTLDHVLVSPALEGNAAVQVMPREALELSDHAAVLVDVDI